MTFTIEITGQITHVISGTTNDRVVEVLDKQALLLSKQTELLGNLTKAIHTILQEQKDMASRIDTFNQKLDALDSAIAMEFQQVKDAIQEVKDQGADGATPEQLDALMARVDTAKANVSGFIADPETAPDPNAGTDMEVPTDDEGDLSEGGENFSG